MERRIIYIFSGLLIVFSIVYPLNLIDRIRVPVYFNLESGIGYDSNFLKLSKSEISEIAFYPSILGDSETASSLIAKNILSIRFNPYFVDEHETQIRIKLNFKNYFSSSNKSYSSFSFYIAQHIGKYEWLKFSYSFTKLTKPSSSTSFTLLSNKNFIFVSVI